MNLNKNIIGKILIGFLKLKIEENGKIATGEGDKTPTELFDSIQKIMNEHETDTKKCPCCGKPGFKDVKN